MAYNYPLSTSDPGGSNLTDAPTYSQLTETWDGMDSSAAAVTQYSVNENATPRSVTITLPNQTKSIQLSYNHPGQYDDGLVYYDETQDANSNKLKSSTALWQQGDYNSPRPTRVESSTFTAHGEELKTATEFSYGAAGTYNQVTEVRAYDFGGTALLRKTDTQYWSNPSRHIFNLPTIVETYDAGGTRVSRTEYTYDGATTANAPGVVQHSDSSNPYAEQIYQPCDCYDEYVDDGHGSGYFAYVCHSSCLTGGYDPSTDSRGNVTQVKTYSDAANLLGAITETRAYDMTGNMITASTSCCQQMSFNYTVDTQYAYPLSQKRGSPSDTTAQVTTSATYDFNTGLVFTATDANGRTSSTGYNVNTLRPVRAILPSGAYTQFGYDDNAMTVTETTYLSSGGSIAAQSTKYLNGLGQIHREEATGAGGAIDEVDTQYDSMGRVAQQSRPFRKNQESPQWTITTYDALGRTASVQAPDGSTTNAYYNEGYSTYPSAATAGAPGETTRVKDAWNRERWGRTDALGRLVEVVEPDPNGSGAVANNGLLTSYSYNANDKLTDVYQGAQHRQFKYDSLGRLVAQKLAEANATLNDNGSYVGGGTWSDVFTYDDRSNMTSRTDARGVKTVFNYNSDPLNRLQSISYVTSGFGDTSHPIQSAPDINYSYMTTGDVTRVSSVTVAGVVTENYSYNDTEARLTDKTVTLSSRSSYPMVTSYVYDQLDRLTDVRYPAQYGVSGNPRKLVHQDYDVASRLNNLTVDGTSYASAIDYNAASQTKSLNIGNGAGGGQLSENYTYDAQTGLLTNQKVQRSGVSNPLLDLSYDYLRQNTSSGRTGQLTKITNNGDASHNHDRSFSYDQIGRLKQAAGGNPTSPLWTQTYTFDRYGNRTTVAASGNAAGTMQTACSGSQTLAVEQFVKNFYQAALGRQPSANELSQQSNALKDAYFQGQSTLLTAAQNIGQQIFTSTEYVNRSRSTTDYVSDLYYSFLGRAPDGDPNNPSTGWGFWVQNTNNNGRQATLNAFKAAGDFSNTVATLCPNVASGSSPIPVDGLPNLTFDSTTNRISTSGFEYDAAGNQTKIVRADGSTQQLQYDAAGRLSNVKDAYNNLLVTNTYGVGNERLISQEGSLRTYYSWSGGASIVEYVESDPSTQPTWTKSYIYLGNRLLATIEPSGASEFVSYQHPDRLGARLITNNQNGSVIEQVHLPYGNALDAESTGATKKRFTSYERSASTGLDYAVNRHYDSQQGRFTTVDPLGAGASSIADPQSFNLYAYCGNNPINRIDPEGLFWGFLKKIIGFVHKVLKWVAIVAFVAATVVLGFAVGAALLGITTDLLGFVSASLAVSAAALGVSLPTGIVGLSGTPPWNPNAGTGLSGVGSAWRRYALNEDDPIDDGDVIRINVNACRNGNKYPHCGAGWWGLVPVIGPAWDAHDAFRSGRWVWGSIHTVMAISDVFLVKAAVTSGARLLARSAVAGLEYAPRIAVREAEDVGLFHNFPRLIDQEVLQYGKRTVKSSTYVEYTLEGTLQRNAGRLSSEAGTVYHGTYEIGVNPATNQIVHRFFRKH
jgi:RHS repeat-associated protein